MKRSIIDFFGKVTDDPFLQDDPLWEDSLRFHPGATASENENPGSAPDGRDADDEDDFDDVFRSTSSEQVPSVSPRVEPPSAAAPALRSTKQRTVVVHYDGHRMTGLDALNMLLADGWHVVSMNALPAITNARGAVLRLVTLVVIEECRAT